MSWEITDLAGVAGIIRESRETWLAKKNWPLEEKRKLLELLNLQVDYCVKIVALARQCNVTPQEIVALMAPDCTCYVIHLEHTLGFLPKN